MTDRELLELAAKAAGIDGEYHVIGIYQRRWPAGLCSDRPYWNPLTDDGDALRLAVKLRIHITMNAFGAAASGPSCGTVEQGPDVYAATRRAIVRAAAAMGAGIPEPRLEASEASHTAQPDVPKAASLAPSAEALPPLPEPDDVAYLKTRVEEYERELREFLASSDTDYLIACCTSMLANRDAVIRYFESARAAEAPRLTDEQIRKIMYRFTNVDAPYMRQFARAIESAIRPSADAGVPQKQQDETGHQE